VTKAWWVGALVGAFVLATGVAAPAFAQTASDPVPKSTTRELTSIKKDLEQYRTDNAKQRDAYLAKYLERFPPDEQTNLRNQTTTALADLTALQRQVDRAAALARAAAPRKQVAAALARAGAPRKQVAAATARAAATAATLTARGDISFDDANKFAASRLSLGEALRAWADYSRSLARLSAISDRLARVNLRL